MRVTQLPAGSPHVLPSGRADGRMNTKFFQTILKDKHFLTGRCFMVKFEDGVVRYEIHLADNPFKGLFKTQDGLFRTGDVLNEKLTAF